MINRAIFFDNDAEKIAQVRANCPGITSVKIPESHDVPLIPLTVEPVKTYSDKFLLNSYVDLLRLTKNAVPYDEVSGIRETHLEPLAALPDGPTSAVLFDWDRTLTLFEGVYTIPYLAPLLESVRALPKYAGITVGYFTKQFLEDMLIYLFGGEERLGMIRRTMQQLHDRGIRIFILTNNGSCTERWFLSYVQTLIPFFKAEQLLCSRNAPYRGDKGAFLKAHPLFHDVCMVPLPVAPVVSRSRLRRSTLKRQRRRRRQTRK